MVAIAFPLRIMDAGGYHVLEDATRRPLAQGSYETCERARARLQDTLDTSDPWKDHPHADRLL